MRRLSASSSHTCPDGRIDVYAAPAIVSLAIPGVSPDEAISANFLGVDGTGAEEAISWSLAPGTASGSFTNTAPIDGTSECVEYTVTDARN